MAQQRMESSTGSTAAAQAPIPGFVVESLHRPWWNNFIGEVGELFQKQPELPPLPKYRDPLPGELDYSPTRLDFRSWYQQIPAFFKEQAEFKKLPPLELSSKPVAVRSIWGAYDNRKRARISSALAHVTVIALIFLVRGGAPEANFGSVTLIIPVDIQPYLAQLKKPGPSEDTGGGGGGGTNSPTPPSRGRLPRFSMDQITPPTPVIKNEDPKLTAEPTVVVADNLNVPQIDAKMFGDPLGEIGPPSGGPGQGGGIGTGRGGGVGSGSGSGVGPGSGGGFGGGVFRVGGGVSAPRLVRKVEPEYSEEARKAKFQGTVTLAVEVWPDGKAHNVRVVRSLGLGLDEKAIEAVQRWEFAPGKKDGKPVKVAATIEVNFRLL